MHIIGEEDDNTNINTNAHGLSGHTPQDSHVQDSQVSVAVPGSTAAANGQPKAVGIFGVNGTSSPVTSLQPGVGPSTNYLGLAPSASRSLNSGAGLSASPTNTRSKFSLNTMNMLNSRRAGNGPSIAETNEAEDQAVAARSLRIVEDQIDFERKYESFKGKLSTEKYKEGIFGERRTTKLPNLILRNAEGNLSPNLSKMGLDE